MFARWIESHGRFAFSLEDNGGIEISGARHAELLAGQASGGRIVVGPNGEPELATAKAPTVDELRASTWEAIKAERDRRTMQGGFQVGEYWFHADTFSRTQQLGLVMLGAGLPAGTQWKTLGGVFVPMTQQLAQQIFAAAAASDIAIFAAAEAHKAAMEASADPAAYDFSGGWPPAYGEQPAG